MELRILIVEDEQPARRKLRNFLEKTELAGEVLEADNGKEAVALIHAECPDLILLDIQMPGMTGFEVVETIGADKMPPVIFVTAYDQYAIQAFEIQAIDYLLKPYDRARLSTSLERAAEKIRQQHDQGDILKGLLSAINQEKQYLERIMVNSGQRFFFIKTADITYLEAEEKYVRIHTRNQSHLIRESLKNLESQLDPARFQRIHRSHIVAIDAIREMQPWSHGDYIAILNDGTELIISRRFRDRLF